MKILLVYSTEGNIEDYAKSLKKGIESNGHTVVMQSVNNGGSVVSCHGYDILIIGSPIKGVFGGKIASDIRPFLETLKRIEGKDSIAFADRKLFGTDKAIRNLMEMMESQGCIVKDFQGFRSTQDAYKFGIKIKSFS